MEYLHTMVRVADLDKALDFYCNNSASRRCVAPRARRAATPLVFLAAPGDVARAKETKSPLLELTYNGIGELYRRAQLRPPGLSGRRLSTRPARRSRMPA